MFILKGHKFCMLHIWKFKNKESTTLVLDKSKAEAENQRVDQ